MKKNKLRKEHNLLAYMLLAPWLIGFFLLFAIPMVASLAFSFTHYNLLSPPSFAGLANYQRIIGDAEFWQSLKVTLIYVGLVVPFRLAVALILAILLAKPSKTSGIYRTIYYIPSVIGGSVAIAIIWKQLFGNPGVVMSLMNNIGFEVKTSFLGNGDTALYVLVLMGVWQFGSSMLIFLAALKQVPRTYYEAASIEGVSPWQKFVHITFPMITPTVLFNVLLQVINSFKVFNEGYIITQGGPGKSTLFYVLNLYTRAFKYLEMGYASALAWVLVMIIVLISFVIFKSQNRWVFYEQKEGK